MNNRAKGLAACREVKKILQEMGYKVDGPSYGIAFFGGKSVPIHRDFFGVLDLITYKDGQYWGHQVTDLNNKSKKVRALEEAGVKAWVWARTKENGKIKYRIFYENMEITQDVT